MDTVREKRRYLIEALQDKEYRDLYVAENIDTGIAFQIRAMREQRNWAQAELGERSGKKQETISQLEGPDYGKHSLTTLKRLASAFDVALVVRFEPFSRLVNYVTRLEPADLAVPSFDTDEGWANDRLVYALVNASTDAQPMEQGNTAFIHPTAANNLYYFARYRDEHARSESHYQLSEIAQG
ncbi:MAG: helix-turn-helix transcriptional regulator [Acidobacteriaceae bacterium]